MKCNYTFFSPYLTRLVFWVIHPISHPWVNTLVYSHILMDEDWISPSWEFSREFLKYWLSSKREDIHWRSDRLPTPVFLGFLCGSAGKESICNVGDLGLIPGLGRYPGEGKGYPLQYSGLENSMDCIVHGVAKSQIRLSDFHHFSKTIYLV